MSCLDPKIFADLSRGRLAEAEAQRATAHIASCAACRTASARVKRATDTLQIIAETPPPPMPSAARVEATLRWMRIEPEPEKRPFLPIAMPRYAMAAAAAAVLLGVGAFAANRLRHSHAEAPVIAHTETPPAPQPAPPVAPEPPRAPSLRAVVTLVSGDVKRARGDGATPEPLGPSDVLVAGDRLVTAPGARVAFQWGEGSGALVEGGGALTLAKLEPKAQELSLLRGEVAVRVGPHQPGESLRVVSPDHTVTVHGTWFIVGAEARGTQVQVLEGVVEIGARLGDGASTRLTAPSRAFFPRERGIAEGERALTGKEAAQLRLATEMGLLAWSGDEALLDLTGMLNVESNPPAQLVVDGVAFGQTPLKLRRLRERHLVELTRWGFSPVRKWITVGEKTEAVVTALHEEDTRPDSVAADSDEAQQVMSSRRRQVSACYEHALKRDPSLAGSVTLELHIGPAGQVLRTSVTADSLGSNAVVDCLRREASGWLFHKARNSTVVYPFVFRAP